MKRKLPRLHAVANDEVLALSDFKARAVAIASIAGTAVHIRSGSLGGRRLTELAESAMGPCEAGHIFLNDRVDIARIVGADGVHLPAAGHSVAFARSLVGPECWIGRSAHCSEEVARAADEGADYVFLGPIWPTASHPDSKPLGPAALSLAYDLPVIAIGGVTPERVAECLRLGAYGVAAISSIWFARDATSTARDLSLSFPP